MTKLSERAMLSKLRVGMWSGQLVDHSVTEEVSDNHGAELKGAGSYSKQIVARRFLRQVGSKVSVARSNHRTMTLPWDDDGTRILSTAAYLQYAEQMRLQRVMVESAASEFVKAMPEYIAEAKTRLGTMFDKTDYPTAEEVRKKFFIDIEIRAVPEAADFRAQLSDASVKSIVKDIERRSTDRIEQAMNDVYARIADVTSKMVERLRAFKPPQGDDRAENIFKDSLIVNVKVLADLIPMLNITGDKRLIELQGRLTKDLLEYSPEILRVDPKLRAATAEKAEKILRKVTQILG